MIRRRLEEIRKALEALAHEPKHPTQETRKQHENDRLESDQSP